MEYVRIHMLSYVRTEDTENQKNETKEMLYRIHDITFQITHSTCNNDNMYT